MQPEFPLFVKKKFMAQHLQFIFPIFYDHFRPNNIFWLGPGKKPAKTEKGSGKTLLFIVFFYAFFSIRQQFLV